MYTVREAITDLLLNYDDPDTPIALAIWIPDDVLRQAGERNININRSEIVEVLDLVHRKQDAMLGISWDTIDAAIDEVVIARNPD